MEQYIMENIIGGVGETVRIIILVIEILLLLWVAFDIIKHKRNGINWLWLVVLVMGNVIAGTALYILFHKKNDKGKKD